MARQRQPENDYPVSLLQAGPFGGIDTTTEPYYVNGSNFIDLMNITPNAFYGGYATVLGRTQLQQFSGICRGIARFARTGLPEGYVYAIDTGTTIELWYSTPGGTPQQLVLPAGDMLTPATQFSFASDLQWLFLTNGVDTPLKIDLDLNVTYWGIVAPTTAPTLLAGAAGNLTGTYYYSITFGNSVQESSQGAISAPITVTAEQVLLTGIPVSTDPQVTQRNIYRIGGSSGIWSLVATINDNTTTTYTDNVADTALGHQLTVFRDPPPPFTVIIAYKERIWGFGTPTDPSIVYFSNYQEPWGFNDEVGNLPVGENSLNDVAVSMSTTGSVLALMKSDSLYAVYGDTQSNFIVSKIADIGCTSLRSACSGFGVCFWQSVQGIYSWDGSSAPSNLSDGTFQHSNIKSVQAGLAQSDLSECTSFVYDRMIHFCYPTLNRTYYYDLRTQNWFVLGWALDQVFARPESVNYKVIGTNLQNPGEIDTWFQTPSDLGGPITAYVVTGISDSGAVQTTKNYRYIMIEAPNQVASATAYVIVNPGSIPEVDVIGFDLSQGGPRFMQDLKMMKGVQVQVRLYVRAQESQVHIQSLSVHGWVERQYNLADNQSGNA